LWYLTFQDEPELANRIAHAQSFLHGVASVDLVPAQWLHLTLDDVGFVDELAADEVDAIVSLARTAVEGVPRFSLSLGHVSLMVDAIVLLAAPESELRQLRDRLRGCTRTVLGSKARHRLRSFSPHVTLAYSNQAWDPGRIMEMSDSDASGPMSVRISRLELAAVTRSRRHYQWTTQAVIAWEEGTSHASAG
jgi:2'-5' RNA ligase